MIWAWIPWWLWAFIAVYGVARIAYYFVVTEDKGKRDDKAHYQDDN